MKRFYYFFVVVFVLMYVGVASAEHPILNMVADKVVQKYQNATCQQLWQEKAESQGKPKPAQEQNAIEILRTNPQLRAEFINKVAAPVVNKMFECGMVP
jgi:hypothetical protein